MTRKDFEVEGVCEGRGTNFDGLVDSGVTAVITISGEDGLFSVKIIRANFFSQPLFLA